MTPLGQAVELRPARLEDAAAIVRHLRRVAASSPYFRVPEEALEVAHEEAFLRQHLQHGFLYLLAWEGEEVVGTLYISRGLRPEIRHVASVAIALSPQAQGRGLGRRMLAEGIAWARQVGVEKLILSVVSENLPALRLYERLGFAEEGRRRRLYRFGDRTADEVYLALDL